MSALEQKPIDLIKTSQDYKPIDITQLDQSIQDMYFNASNEYKDIIENIFNEKVLEYSRADRPLPPYVDGFLDKPFLAGGKPTQPKALAVFNAVLSGNIGTIEVEGGVRGSKDVVALLAWSRFLQVCPDQMHLALGTSLEHVLKTVLMSDRFGLFFTIPHGIFVRESISGAQRGAYKFVDNYGREKQILFYGNDKENDADKFQGFTLGSVYVNETLNQNVTGLTKAEDRMASAKQPLMLMTQNPKGKAHPFYQQFEKSKLKGLREIEQLEFIRDTYSFAFKDLEDKIKKDRNAIKKQVQDKFYEDKGVPSYKYLSTREQIYLNEKMLEINFNFDKILRNKTVQEFYPHIKEGDYLWNKSMKKVVNYFRGGDNNNQVFNFYDFAYFHFTVDDNMSMSEMQRNDFKNKRAKGTSGYDQQVLGIRRSTDSAVYGMFTSKNIFGGDIHQFDNRGMIRVMALDKGLNHPNGIIDCEVDFRNGTVYQLQESLLDVKQEDVVNLGIETIYQDVLRIIRQRSDRKMPAWIIVDPSAIETIMYLRQRGLPVREANNAVWSIKGEKEESHQIQDKDLIGIPFVQTAIAKLKYMVHESNVHTIEQIGSYEAPFDPKAGKEKVKKVNDDLVDPIRYIFNTLIRMGMWEGDTDDGKPSEKEHDDAGSISGNDESQKSQRGLAEQLVKAFYGEEYESEDSNGYNDFFGNSSGFFGN